MNNISTSAGSYPDVSQPEEFVKALNVKEQALIDRPEQQIFSLAMMGGRKIYEAAHPYGQSD